MEEARTVIPPKDVLERNILEVSLYCYCSDASLELKWIKMDKVSVELASLLVPKPFFKPMSSHVLEKNRKSFVILTLMDHVKNGCLLDPPGVVLHRMNPKTKRIKCC
jgi:hypothetical protein